MPQPRAMAAKSVVAVADGAVAAVTVGDCLAAIRLSVESLNTTTTTGRSSRASVSSSASVMPSPPSPVKHIDVAIGLDERRGDRRREARSPSSPGRSRSAASRARRPPRTGRRAACGRRRRWWRSWTPARGHARCATTSSGVSGRAAAVAPRRPTRRARRAGTPARHRVPMSSTARSASSSHELGEVTSASPTTSPCRADPKYVLSSTGHEPISTTPARYAHGAGISSTGSRPTPMIEIGRVEHRRLRSSPRS